MLTSQAVRTKDYYDEFAAGYEKERGKGYHRLIDDLEINLVLRYARGADVLEAGCGTGLLLDRIRSFANTAWGVDLSPGMLAKARSRRLPVVQGSITDLPFPSDRFGVVCSFKVLAHVQPIREALLELARVTRPGGHLILEFYNPYSLRYLVKVLKPATPISTTTTDTQVFTRYDSLAAVREYLPPGLVLESIRGVRIVSPASYLFRIPPLASALTFVEHSLADVPVLRRLGGFMIVVLRKA